MFFENNLRLLKELGAGDAFDRQWPELEDIVVKPSRKSAVTMQFLAQGRRLYVHSAYDPEKEAVGLAESIPLSHKSVALIFGAGLMYHVKALIKLTKCRILVVEPDIRVFALALREIDLSDVFMSGRAAFSIAPSEDELRSFLSVEITRANFFLTETIRLPAYAEKYPSELSAFTLAWKELRQRLETEVVTICNQSALWAQNTVSNIKSLPESVRFWSFRHAFAKRPGVICSSGPSLDKNIALLRRLKDRALIVAAYTSLNALRKHGVVPDIVVGIDARQTRRESEGQVRPLESPLLYVSSSDFRLIDKAEAGKIFATTEDDLFIRQAYANSGIEDGFIFLSGSVATAATDFAVISGCDPIIFIGQDLAFTGERVHSDTVENLQGYLESQLEDAYYVDDVYGGRVLTSPLMDMYRQTLEQYIRHDSRRYIDATEGGALIAGTEVLPLEEVITRLSGVGTGVGEIMAAHLKNPANRSLNQRQTDEYLQEIADVNRDLENDSDLRRLASLIDKPCEQDFELADKVYEYLKGRTVYFDIGLRHAESAFVRWFKERYMKRLIKKPHVAGFYRKKIIARLLLEWLEAFKNL